jgi:uncharacterized membrane protein
MDIFLPSLFIGVIAGLRAMTAPAAVSWAARLGWLDLAATPLAFLGYAFTPWIMIVLALGELVSDKLPTTPSRKLPAPFAGRILSGALCGGAVGAAGGALVIGAITGAIGGVIGTIGGHAFRARLATAFGRDLPAALLEDVVAVGGAALIMMALL